MTALQPRLASGIILLVAIWVCWISFSQTPAEAFLFPRLISVAFVILAGWTFARTLLDHQAAEGGLTRELVKSFLPGVVVAGIYVFFAAKWLGFYTSSAIAFIVILSLYDPAPHNQVRTWLKRLAIAAGYLAVMYLLFSVVLKVFTPRGLFI